jgi:hypothetical protein
VRSLIVGLAALAVAGCASRPPLVDEGAAQAAQPVAGSAGSGALREIAVPRGIHFGYKIYGDPGAAPSQAFDDGRFLFLQFKQGVPPPIPVTRDGKLLEYEVMAGGLVRTSKVDSVVLRLGPRVAYVDREGVEIIALPTLSGAPQAASLVVERPPSMSQRAEESVAASPPKTRSVPEPKEEVRRLSVRGSSAKEIVASVKDASLGPGLWRLCHSPSVRDLRLARQAKEALESSFDGVRLMLSDSCGAPGELRLEKL